MIKPEIVVHLNPGAEDPAIAHRLNKAVLERMERDLAKLQGAEPPTHRHTFEFLRQERHVETGEIQDVFFCTGCTEYRFRRTGPFRAYTGW